MLTISLLLHGNLVRQLSSTCRPHSSGKKGPGFNIPITYKVSISIPPSATPHTTLVITKRWSRITLCVAFVFHVKALWSVVASCGECRDDVVVVCRMSDPTPRETTGLLLVTTKPLVDLFFGFNWKLHWTLSNSSVHCKYSYCNDSSDF